MHPVMLGQGLRMFTAEIARQRFEVAEQAAFGNGLTAWVLMILETAVDRSPPLDTPHGY